MPALILCELIRPLLTLSHLCRDDPGEREADAEEPEGGEDAEGAQRLGVARVRRQRVADRHVPAKGTTVSLSSF